MTTGPTTDTEIQQSVIEEIKFDPEVEVTDVGVEVDDGVVTLTGTVDTYAIKKAAEQAAFRVEGVRAVANEIVVQPWGAGAPSDTEIAKAVADALRTTFDVPVERIDIKVEDGRVTLSGEVDWNYQRMAAEKAVHPIAGIKGISNQIEVRQPPVSAQDIRTGIERAFVRSARINASQIQVHVEGGRVTLTGTVRNLAECTDAEEAAWRAQGVTEVTNDLRVQPEAPASEA